MDTNTQAIRRTLGVLLLASFTAVGCASTAMTPTVAPPPFVQTDADGKFSAEFPFAPRREQQTQTISGINLVTTIYTTETAKDGLTVGYTDYPKSLKLTDALDGAAQGSASKVNGVIQSKTATTFMGHPAMDVVVKAPEGMVHERLILRGQRLYMLIGVAESGRPPSYDHLVETFYLI